MLRASRVVRRPCCLPESLFGLNRDQKMLPNPELSNSVILVAGSWNLIGPLFSPRCTSTVSLIMFQPKFLN